MPQIVGVDAAQQLPRWLQWPQVMQTLHTSYGIDRAIDRRNECAAAITAVAAMAANHADPAHIAWNRSCHKSWSAHGLMNTPQIVGVIGPHRGESGNLAIMFITDHTIVGRHMDS